jgi:hypothetical protein
MTRRTPNAETKSKRATMAKMLSLNFFIMAIYNCHFRHPLKMYNGNEELLYMVKIIAYSIYLLIDRIGSGDQNNKLITLIQQLIHYENALIAKNHHLPIAFW